MLRNYVNIIRQARIEGRRKGDVYYEAHHIIPKSFNKRSTTVLLTPEEHYECHRILAEEFKNHPIYGKKMLWAFHRLAYDKQRRLTVEEYAEARKLLIPLWTRKQTKEHRQKISKAMVGNRNNSSRVYKGMKSSMSAEGREKLARLRKLDRTGKSGYNALTSKGAVIYEHEDGRSREFANALQLSQQLQIPQSTVSYRLNRNPGRYIDGYRVYYKNVDNK